VLILETWPCAKYLLPDFDRTLLSIERYDVRYCDLLAASTAMVRRNLWVNDVMVNHFHFIVGGSGEISRY